MESACTSNTVYVKREGKYKLTVSETLPFQFRFVHVASYQAAWSTTVWSSLESVAPPVLLLRAFRLRTYASWPIAKKVSNHADSQELRCICIIGLLYSLLFIFLAFVDCSKRYSILLEGESCQHPAAISRKKIVRRRPRLLVVVSLSLRCHSRLLHRKWNLTSDAGASSDP